MQRPLFLCLIGLVLGEAAAISMGWKGGLISVLFFCMAGFLIWKMSEKQNRFFIFTKAQCRSVFCIFLIFYAIGFILFLSEKDLDQRIPFNESRTVFGTASARIVQLKIDGEGNYEIVADQFEFALDNRSDIFQLKGKCRITGIQKKQINLFPDDRILCRGTLREIDRPTNPGEFDAKIYYRSRGITMQLQGEKCQVCMREKISFRKAAFCLKEKILSVYTSVMSKEQAALLQAMILGEKSDLSDEQKNLYEENGVAHLLAVSGLHVSIVGGKIFQILRKRGFSYGISCFGGGWFLLFYGCVTGFGHSVVRAVFMYIFYLGSEYFGAQYDLVSAMALSGILMLIEEPWRILEGGFQISFLSILSIGLVLPWIKKLSAQRSRRMEGELSMAPPQFQIIKEGVLASFIISGTTLPFILRQFYQWSPYSIILNLLVIPCMTPLMLGGLFCGLSGMLSWKAAFILKLLPCGILELFQWIFEKIRTIPGSLLVTGCPSILEMAGIYLFEIILLILWYYRLWWKMAGVVVAGCWLFCFRTPSDLQMTMLDVGQGESIFFQMPEGSNILIDGGSTSRSKVGKYVILPAIKYYGAASLDYVIITHMDEDHISGIVEILEQGCPVKHLILPDLKNHDTVMDKLIELAEENGTEVMHMKRGGQLSFGEADLVCLHPFDDFSGADRNASSLVFYLKYGQFDGLFTGDLDEDGEKEVCDYLKKNASFLPLPSANLEVLKVAHHGSKYSTGQEFLNQLLPQTALISAGRKNRYGHPHRELLQRLSDANCEVFETRNGGAITLKTDGNTWEIDSYR